MREAQPCAQFLVPFGVAAKRAGRMQLSLGAARTRTFQLRLVSRMLRFEPVLGYRVVPTLLDSGFQLCLAPVRMCLLALVPPRHASAIEHVVRQRLLRCAGCCSWCLCAVHCSGLFGETTSARAKLIALVHPSPGECGSGARWGSCGGRFRGGRVAARVAGGGRGSSAGALRCWRNDRTFPVAGSHIPQCISCRRSRGSSCW